MSGLEFDHHVIALDLYRDRLRNIRPLDHARARLDMRRIRFHAEAAGIAIGLAGADVEFPAVPGTADDLPQLGVFDLAGIARLRKPDQRALAQRRALMRATVHQAEILALDVEDRDRPSLDLQKF